MKRLFALFAILLFLLPGCDTRQESATIAATTLPVYEFTLRLCEGTDITVTRLVTEPVSCLHDYSLNVNQVRAAENADVIVVSGAGLEAFLEDILEDKPRIDASTGIELICGGEEEQSGGLHGLGVDRTGVADNGNGSNQSGIADDGANGIAVSHSAGTLQSTGGGNHNFGQGGTNGYDSCADHDIGQVEALGNTGGAVNEPVAALDQQNQTDSEKQDRQNHFKILLH